jgi:anti-sigma factor RsiW
MSEIDGKALWDRFRAAEPDPLTLAAYAEGRLAADAAASVERWLAVDPDAAADVALARAALAPVEASEAGAADRVAARAARLVSGRVIPFRVRIRRWTEVSALAASVALIAYLGFALGAAQVPASDDSAEVFDNFTLINSFIDEFQA